MAYFFALLRWIASMQSLDYEYAIVFELTHDVYENTWDCGELKLYFSPFVGGLRKKKKLRERFWEQPTATVIWSLNSAGLCTIEGSTGTIVANRHYAAC